jgi:glycosyltransferase involved in cell wall biosynthesis
MRTSEIIFPPVGLTENEKKKIFKTSRGKYYLIVNRLIPYKKVDLAIKAFNKLGHRLYVVGSGSEEEKLKRMAKKNIKFMGQIEDRKLIGLYRNAKALIMPQKEDFGIVAVEAQSMGVPVIAYRKGGAVDTIIEGKTGILFSEQTTISLIDAVKKFEKTDFMISDLLSNSEKFSKNIFRKKFLELVKSVLT